MIDQVAVVVTVIVKGIKIFMRMVPNAMFRNHFL